MRPALERLLLIEQQLLNGPAALPAADWYLRQLLDGELAADAAAQQQLYHGLRAAGRQQLRHELRAIHARLYTGPFGWLRRLWPG
ncbi:hypothetical protein [Hymenobacter sp. UYCo722]|uniref:hypothetical protein n=1 Tax=Hymenobacter sp. UYCo722 TaxID=3156335 RepID=UPI0033939981